MLVFTFTQCLSFIYKLLRSCLCQFHNLFFQRKPGHDWCLIRLGVRGQILGFEVDTAFFTGNYSPKFSIQGYTGSDLESKLSPRDPSMGKEASEQELEEVNGHSLMTSPSSLH